MILSLCIQCVELSEDLIKKVDAILTRTSKIECVISFYRGSYSEVMGHDNYIGDRVIFKKIEAENVGTARNACLSSSTGDFLLFCDCTDFIETSELIWLINFVKFRSIDFAVGGINLKSTGLSLFNMKEPSDAVDLVTVSQPNHTTVSEVKNFFPARFVISRSLFSRAGAWNEAPSILSDFELLCRFYSISKLHRLGDDYRPVLNPLIEDFSLAPMPRRAIDGTLLHLHLVSSHLKNIFPESIATRFIDNVKSSLLELCVPPNSPLHQYTKNRMKLLRF